VKRKCGRLNIRALYQFGWLGSVSRTDALEWGSERAHEAGVPLTYERQCDQKDSLFTSGLSVRFKNGLE
jgi:hypothetical protein